MRQLASLISIVASVVIAGQASAADTKQPWEWTSQERAQARRDPAKRLERLRADAQERRSHPISSKSLPPLSDVIDGKRNPELYFPTELFEYLVRSAFVTLPGVYVHVVQQRTSDLFRNPADWDRFAAIVADYARVLQEEHGAADTLDKKAVDAIQSRKCAAEALALRDARQTFGKTRFDRMLYETVPVSMSRSYSADTNFEVSIGSALAREEHCQ
jgi:hypothetical protein